MGNFVMCISKDWSLWKRDRIMQIKKICMTHLSPFIVASACLIYYPFFQVTELHRLISEANVPRLSKHERFTQIPKGAPGPVFFLFGFW